MTLAHALAAPTTFSVPHIALTAFITGIFALATALWRLPRGAWTDIAATGIVAAVAVLLWRWSANMPQLNDDGLPGFSANDWAAPILTYVLLGVYAGLRPPTDPRRYGQTRALVFAASLAVNVITI